MKDGIVIEQMKLSERDQVLDFLRVAYSDNPRHSDPTFWNWHFPGSPYCDPDDLPIWLAKADGRIVGQLASTPVELSLGEASVKAIWILDLIVDPNYRRMGIGRELALASKAYCDFILGINTTAQHSTELLEGLGWVIFTKIARYQRLLFPGEAIREIGGVPLLRSLVNSVYAPFRPRAAQAAHKSRAIRSVSEIDASFDTLWNEARGHFAVAIARTAAMVNWQFRKQPGKEFQVLGYFDGRRLLGYVVLFFRKANAHGAVSKAAISDICYHPDHAKETVDALLVAALDLAVERRAGSLVTDAIDPLLEDRLKRHGFRGVKSSLQLLANVAEHQETIYDASNWYLTRGDSDISIFEDPNI